MRIAHLCRCKNPVGSGQGNTDLWMNLCLQRPSSTISSGAQSPERGRRHRGGTAPCERSGPRCSPQGAWPHRRRRLARGTPTLSSLHPELLGMGPHSRHGRPMKSAEKSPILIRDFCGEPLGICIPRL